MMNKPEKSPTIFLGLFIDVLRNIFYDKNIKCKGTTIWSQKCTPIPASKQETKRTKIFPNFPRQRPIKI
jgi:hypothetical protein